MQLPSSLKQFINGLKEEETPSFIRDIEHGENELSAREKLEVSKFFLSKIQQRVQEKDKEEPDHLVPLVSAAESLSPDNPEVLFSVASFFYRFGMVTGKKHYLFFAEEKMQRIPELFISKNPLLLQLWGNILISLAVYADDMSYAEKGIAKLEKVSSFITQNREESVCKNPFLEKFYETALIFYSFDSEIAFDFREQLKEVEVRANLFWDIGSGWALLGEHSEEPADYYKSIAAFQKGEQFGLNRPYFWISYAKSHFALSSLTGDVEHLKIAIIFFQKALFLLGGQKERGAYGAAWREYAKAAGQLALMTGDESYFKKADEIFRDAILACPSISSLWLEWTKLHTRFGQLTKNITLLETALDKLAASKVLECDETSVLILISDVLMPLGFYLDRFHLLKEGEKRLMAAALKSVEKEADIATGFGRFFLYNGLYFDDERDFPKAIMKFKEALAVKASHLGALEGLFQAYLAWGEKEENPLILKKAIRTIRRLLELRCLCPYTHADAGVAYIKLFFFESNILEKERILRKAIDLFEEALRLKGASSPSDWLLDLGDAYDLLGDLTGEERDYEKAIEHLTLLYERDPYFLDVQPLLASVFSHLGELTENTEHLYQALDLFDQAIQREQDNSKWMTDRGYIYLLLAEIEFDSINRERKKEILGKAEKDFIASVKLGHPEASYYLACTYSLAGFFDASMEYLHKADKLGYLSDIAMLEEERWLDDLRQTSSFKEFVSNKKYLDL